MSSVEIDTRAFFDALERSAGEIDRESKKELRKLAGKVRTVIRQNAPRRTGALRKSVRTRGRSGADGYYVEISAMKFYAKFVEFGTSRSPAHPFFRPALQQAAGMFRSQQVGGADPGTDA